MKKYKVNDFNLIECESIDFTKIGDEILSKLRTDTSNLLKSNVGGLFGRFLDIFNFIAIKKTQLNLGLACGLLFLANGEIGLGLTGNVKIKNYGNLTKLERKSVERTIIYSNHFTFWNRILRIIGLGSNSNVSEFLVPILAEEKE